MRPLLAGLGLLVVLLGGGCSAGFALIGGMGVAAQSTVATSTACGATTAASTTDLLADPPTGQAAAFVASIVEQESGGRYDALGKVIPKTGDRAYGKYQVMGANIGPWSELYLGRRVGPNEYLASPAIQDAVAVAHLTALYDRHGARGAAAAWYSGQPGKHLDVRPQFGGPSIKTYVDEVVARMGPGAPTALTAPAPTTDLAPAPGVAPELCEGLGGTADPASFVPGAPATSTAGLSSKAAAWGGHGNGRIPPAELCEVAGDRLRCDAAHAFAAMAAAFEADLGRPLTLTDGYRDYPGQVDTYARRPGLAAVPGTSNHGWALAVDLGSGVESFGTPGHRWMQQNGPRFGFVHPGWARAGGKRPEPWHWEFVGTGPGVFAG